MNQFLKTPYLFQGIQIPNYEIYNISIYMHRIKFLINMDVKKKIIKNLSNLNLSINFISK